MDRATLPHAEIDHIALHIECNHQATSVDRQHIATQTDSSRSIAHMCTVRLKFHLVDLL